MSPQRTTSEVDNVEAAEAPSFAERSIFRSEALQHYQENQEKVALPPLVSPRVFVYLWVLAGLTMVIGLLLACWPWLDSVAAGVR